MVRDMSSRGDDSMQAGFASTITRRPTRSAMHIPRRLSSTPSPYGPSARGCNQMVRDGRRDLSVRKRTLGAPQE